MQESPLSRRTIHLSLSLFTVLFQTVSPRRRPNKRRSGRRLWFSTYHSNTAYRGRSLADSSVLFGHSPIRKFMSHNEKTSRPVYYFLLINGIFLRGRVLNRLITKLKSAAATNSIKVTKNHTLYITYI